MTDFYDQNAAEFFASTIDVDMSPLYGNFLPLVPKGGHILDAGCGSGRDAKHFLQCGYRVTALDASQTLCDLASEHIGQNVYCMHFNEMAWQRRFDAVWACASLLHVPQTQLPTAFSHLIRALKPNGVMYASFKYGHGERQKDGRHFTDMNEDSIAELISQTDHLDLMAQWLTEDRRPDRVETWINILLRKEPLR